MAFFIPVAAFFAVAALDTMDDIGDSFEEIAAAARRAASAAEEMATAAKAAAKAAEDMAAASESAAASLKVMASSSVIIAVAWLVVCGIYVYKNRAPLLPVARSSRKLVTNLEKWDVDPSCQPSVVLTSPVPYCGKGVAHTRI